MLNFLKKFALGLLKFIDELQKRPAEVRAELRARLRAMGRATAALVLLIWGTCLGRWATRGIDAVLPSTAAAGRAASWQGVTLVLGLALLFAAGVGILTWGIVRLAADE